LTLGRRGQGRTWPNPAVGGCGKDGFIVGRGWTQPGGRPHAEPEALGAPRGRRAPRSTDAGTVLACREVAPCPDAIIAAGISRVVSAIEIQSG